MRGAAPQTPQLAPQMAKAQVILNAARHKLVDVRAAHLLDNRRHRQRCLPQRMPLNIAARTNMGIVIVDAWDEGQACFANSPGHVLVNMCVMEIGRSVTNLSFTASGAQPPDRRFKFTMPAQGQCNTNSLQMCHG